MRTSPRCLIDWVEVRGACLLVGRIGANGRRIGRDLLRSRTRSQSRHHGRKRFLGYMSVCAAPLYTALLHTAHDHTRCIAIRLKFSHKVSRHRSVRISSQNLCTSVNSALYENDFAWYVPSGALQHKATSPRTDQDLCVWPTHPFGTEACDYGYEERERRRAHHLALPSISHTFGRFP